MVSTETLEILAVSDRKLFENAIQEVGLHVEGRIHSDPLETQVQSETVASIASELTEDANTYVDASPEMLEAKKMAEDYGYIVSIVHP